MEPSAEKTRYLKKCSLTKELKSEIGKNLREMRQQKGWSQEYLGYFSNTTQDTIARIEGGNAGLSLLIFLKLTTALEKPINSIFINHVHNKDI